MSSADAIGLEKERPEEKAAAAENPLVFLCARCRRPLGDSLTWVASQEDTNCILLRTSPVTSLWIRNRNCPSAEMKTVASLRRCTARAAPSALAMCTDALLRTWTTSSTCSASALKPLKVTP
uniref:Protein yippee-like n=1 Tax=Mus musculus TaxID=10090 RepID=Q9D086_MOUSE|nr:unnamed protein product [Mus musculus]